ncbi:MAG: YqgE/AlgH family protein [Planctomycetaceae bacterium]|nr:YqgE/AlgH family protein [Planctomycetaceae bacterium]
MQNLTGQVLASSPSLLDPNFKQTVILMIQDAGEGAIGLVLNRPSDKTVRNLWATIFQDFCETEQPIHLGGPVFGPLMILHTRRELADLEIMPGLYFATQKNYIEDIVNGNVQPYKLFLGHTGWGEGQLQNEINEGAWYSLPADLKVVFSEDPHLWQHVLHCAGRRMLSRVFRINNFPDDPTWN